MMEEKEFYKYLSVFIKSKRKELKLTNEDLSYLSKIDVSKYHYYKIIKMVAMHIQYIKYYQS